VSTLDQLARRRMRIAGVLTAVIIVAYFGFILLVAFGKSFVGDTIGDDVSIGIVIGACVIVLAPVLTGIYVRWANRHYDAAARALKDKEKP
jgi:uncharacterized membrane protein (DUF485 family)